VITSTSIDDGNCSTLRTPEFLAWLLALRDSRAKARVVEQIERLTVGNPGHSKSVGSGVLELKIDYGPGYRV
jgi:putative addiction module killer protein